MEHIARRLRGQQADREDAPSTCPTWRTFAEQAPHAGPGARRVRDHRAARRARRLEGRAPGPAGAARPRGRDAARALPDGATRSRSVADRNPRTAAAGLRASEYRGRLPAAESRADARAAVQGAGKRGEVVARRGCTSGCGSTATGVDCTLDEVLALTTLRDGDRLVIYPRADRRLRGCPRPSRRPSRRRRSRCCTAPARPSSRIDVSATTRGVHRRRRAALSASPAGRGTRLRLLRASTQPLDDGDSTRSTTTPTTGTAHFCAEVIEGLCAGGHEHAL